MGRKASSDNAVPACSVLAFPTDIKMLWKKEKIIFLTLTVSSGRKPPLVQPTQEYLLVRRDPPGLPLPEGDQSLLKGKVSTWESWFHVAGAPSIQPREADGLLCNYRRGSSLTPSSKPLQMDMNARSGLETPIPLLHLQAECCSELPQRLKFPHLRNGDSTQIYFIHGAVERVKTAQAALHRISAQEMHLLYPDNFH